MSKSISREEVKAKYQAVKEELAKLAEQEAPAYKTDNKYLPGIGLISELETMKDVAKAAKYIKEESGSFESAVEGVELTEAEAAEALAETTIMGFKPSVWLAEINQRVVELRKEKRIADLEKAKKILKKNLSEDDKFALDMESIAETVC